MRAQIDRAYEPQGYCPHCGYRMDAGQCPECGQAVPRPSRRNPFSRRRRVVRWCGLILALAGLGAGMYWGGPDLAARWWPEWHLKQLVQGDGALAVWASHALEEREIRRFNAAIAALKVRQRHIEGELAGLGPHEWAGVYGRGGFGTEPLLYISPASGFTYEASGGVDYWFNYGEVEYIAPDQIRLKRLGGCRHEDPTTVEYILLHWRPRRYLVPKDELIAFCNRLNAGYTHIYALVRESEASQPVSGAPELPEAYRVYLLPKPLAAKVVSFQANRTKWPEFSNETGPCFQLVVTLDAGRRQGVLPGMKFYGLEIQAIDRGAFSQVAVIEAEVTAVQENSCVAATDFYFEKEDGHSIHVGSPFSTYDFRSKFENSRYEEEKKGKQED